MNQEEILNCILNPDRLKEIAFDRLKQTLTDYPYSQNLHFLLAQKSMQEAHPDFERHLKTAATYMSSRSFLRKQLQGSDRPSQPIVEPEPEAEPAQGNSTLTVAPQNTLIDLPDEELPPVLFFPDTPIEEEENIPNHVADIVTDTPPADQPPPNETSTNGESPEIMDPIPPIISKISPNGNQINDPEIAPVEKKLLTKHEPIIEQSRIIDEPGHPEEAPEEPIAAGSNIPDMPEAQMEYVPGIKLDEEKLEEPDSSTKTPEIIEFPKQFDFEDEMDDLLNKPLIEVIPERFAKIDIEAELDEEDEISDLLLEDFEEILITEDLDPVEEEEPLTIQPGLGKWMKKYQSSENQKPAKTKGKKKAKKKEKQKNKEEMTRKEEVKTKPSKTKKKKKKKSTLPKTEPKEKKNEKTIKNKGAKTKKTRKKKKKTPEQKLSKKKAIRKFANRSIVEDGETISVTLADLYVKQGKIEKAIVAYERLSLIIPEKKAFFASLIKKLKKK